MNSLRITLIGGPTALIEVDGFRLLTDPTFDAPGAYQLPHVTLEKLSGPALGAEAIGEVDAVLLSHDQHADNLDHSGKAFLARAKRVLTTVCRRQTARRPCRRPHAMGNHRIGRQGRACVDDHRDTRTPWPGRYRAAVR
jgi:L-ascorbate metabolism protein UlaG (beta-lactamase superfamily)